MSSTDASLGGACLRFVGTFVGTVFVGAALQTRAMTRLGVFAHLRRQAQMHLKRHPQPQTQPRPRSQAHGEEADESSLIFARMVAGKAFVNGSLLSVMATTFATLHTASYLRVHNVY